MSRLPSASTALVEAKKVRDYLLNPDNAQNGGKAARFTRFGFARSSSQTLASALRRHPLENDVVRTATSVHGTKYVVQCRLDTPDGTNPCLSTIWIIEAGTADPRLVTAY